MNASAKIKTRKGWLSPNQFLLFLPEIKELLSEKSFNQVKDLLKDIHSIDIADGWINLEPQEKILVFKLFSTRKSIEVFEDLKFSEQSYLLNNLDNAEIASVLNDMASDERAQLFKDLPGKVNKKLVSLMKKEEADDLAQLLTFEEGTAGSLMTTEFVTLRKDMTARQALIHIQESHKAGTQGNIHSIYVIDDRRHLIGMVTLQTVITAPPDMLIKDIMTDSSLIKVGVDTEDIEVANKFSRYDLVDAPVVNADNILSGIITIDDVVDLVEEETTREIYEIGKMSSSGEEIRYAQATVFDLIKRRAGWLIMLLVFHVFSGWILKNFEYALGTVVALAFFIPMLLDTGGNAGAQTSITIIRSFATGDASFKNIWRIARLEICASLIMSAIVGIVAFLRAYWLEGAVAISIVVGITMTSIVLVAILTGIFLPFLSKRIGMDPAALAGPITTTVVDVTGLIIYFKIAQIFLPALR